MKRIPRVEKDGQCRLVSLIHLFLPHLLFDSMDVVQRDELMKSFLVITNVLQDQRPDIVKQLWSSLASTESNVKHITNSLLSISLIKVSLLFSMNMNLMLIFFHFKLAKFYFVTNFTKYFRLCCSW